MKRWSAAVLVLGLTGCSSPLQQFSAPAPAGAVECAVREAEEIGYRRLEGSVEAGVVRLGRYLPPAPAREPTDPEVRLSDRQGPGVGQERFESQLRISERRGQLRVAVLAVSTSDAARGDPGGPAGDARQILAECSTSQ